MKNLKYVIIFIMTPLFANADILVEREMYNSRNGENYNCKIHSDMKTELVNDGVSVGKFNTEFSASETDFKKWLKELKTQVASAKFKLESKKIPQYTIRGFKRYSLYNGKSKVSFYNLQHDVKKSSRGRKLSTVASGSIQTKVKDDNSNVQRLRGQTDEACKKALAKL